MFVVAITQFVPLNQRCRRYFFEYLFIIVNLFLRARAFFQIKAYLRFSSLMRFRL